LVLEDMRKLAASLRVEPESNIVVNGHCDHMSRCVRCDHHVQAICQFGAFDSNLESFHEPPPVAFAFEISPKELLSSSLNTPVASSASARAARLFSTSYASTNSFGERRRACKCA